jgi:RNA polymerase sigma-70 factor, ECF subfamily
MDASRARAGYWVQSGCDPAASRYLDVGSTILPPTLTRVSTDPRHAAFREHVLPELEVMLRVARRLTGDASEAEDLVQDALVRAYRALDRFDGHYPRAWLLTILRNTHYNRRRKRTPDLLENEVVQRLRDQDAPEDGTAEAALAEGFQPLVLEALGRLSLRHRQVIALVDLDGLTYRETAGVLGVPEGTVMSRLHRARAKVRAYLEENGFEEEAP